jgi:hypothetical protein
MAPPKQLSLPLAAKTPTARPRTSPEADREAAIAASGRYLDAIETRAKTAPGALAVDRTNTLVDVAQRRRRLQQAKRR